MTESESNGQMTHETEGEKRRAELEAIRARQRAARSAMVERLAENRLLPHQSFNLADDER